MILEFNQVDRQPNPLFEGKINNQIVVSGKGASRYNNCFIHYNLDKYEISDKTHKDVVDGEKVTQISDIFKNDNKIGYIYPTLHPTKKFLFLSFGYDYFKVSYEDNNYSLYEVGLGPNQHFFCLHNENNVTVAIIKKEDKKINFCDNYTVYAVDNALLPLLSIIALYIDSILYPDYGDITGDCKEDDSCITLQKELIEKYDADFIPYVLSLEEKYSL